MNRGIETLCAGSSILADKIENFASKAQDIATKQMEKAQEIAVKAQDIAVKQMEKNQEIAVAEIDLKRKRLEMAVAARQDQVSAAKAETKSKFAPECLQYIPMENREAFIKEYLGKM